MIKLFRRRNVSIRLLVFLTSLLILNYPRKRHGTKTRIVRLRLFCTKNFCLSSFYYFFSVLFSVLFFVPHSKNLLQLSYSIIGVDLYWRRTDLTRGLRGRDSLEYGCHEDEGVNVVGGEGSFGGSPRDDTLTEWTPKTFPKADLLSFHPI